VLHFIDVAYVAYVGGASIEARRRPIEDVAIVVPITLPMAAAVYRSSTQKKTGGRFLLPGAAGGKAYPHEMKTAPMWKLSSVPSKASTLAFI
jgi:hypothetical protein